MNNIIVMAFWVLLSGALHAHVVEQKDLQSTALRVGFVNPGYQDKGFWLQVSNVMKAAAAQLNIDLYEVYGDRHWKQMLREGSALITAQSLDYLVLVNEHQKAGELMKLAEAREIPTFLLLNGLAQDDPRAMYPNWAGSLIPDNQAAGLEMARALFASRQGTGGLFTLVGDTITPASLERTSGLDDALSMFPSVKEWFRGSGQWSHDVAYHKTKLFLHRGRPTMVWAANDDIALGVIKAMKETHMEPGSDVSVVGLNWSPQGIEAVKTGELLMTHGGHFMAGAWMMVLVYDHFYQHSVPQKHAFRMSAITSDNVDKYQTCFGQEQWQNIDYKRFSLAQDKVLSKPGAGTASESHSGYDFSLSNMIKYSKGC